MSDGLDKDFLTKEVDMLNGATQEERETTTMPEETGEKLNNAEEVKKVKKERERKRDRRKKELEQAEVLEEIDGKQAVISAKAMLANIDNNPGLSEEHKQSLKEATLKILMDFFKNKKIVFDEESYREFERLEHKDLLLKVSAFKDAAEEFNDPDRKLGELLKEYDNIKELLSKVASLERELREVIESIEELKVKVENMDRSLNDRINDLETRIEDVDKLRKDIEEHVRDYVETNKPDMNIDEKWIEERVLKILRELEVKVGTDENAIRVEIERIVREEIDRAVSQLQFKREEDKSEEGPKVEMLKETEIKSNVAQEQEKPKKGSFIAGVPDVVVYIVVALGLIFFVMQLLG